jgi:serine-type D-Ala-D-Ala carboxypeptidase
MSHFFAYRAECTEVSSEIINTYLRERIEAGDFPSAVYLLAERGEIIFHDALGFAVVEPERIEARKDTVYDLASVTKVLVTGMLAAKLIEEGMISVDSPVSGYLPDLRSPEITVLDLLCHTSGLPAWYPFYLSSESREDVLRTAARLQADRGQRRVNYSDPNFILLTFLIEKVYGEQIDATAKRLIFDALNLADTWFNPPAALRPRIAASERGNEFEKELCRELGFDVTTRPQAFRDGIIRGDVHDGNAYFMGGVGGHAGLFSTADEIFRMAREFLPKYATILNPETCELFRTNFTKGMNEGRSLSFQLASTKDSTAGTEMPAGSFGHNGFTGTSLWIDPVNDRIFILLTNRTHNHSLPFANINGVRRRFHDLAVEALSRET